MEVVVTVTTGKNNDYTISELNYLKDSIEKLDHFYQVEILRILSKHKEVKLNENQYGVHVNLTDVGNDVIHALTMYVQFAEKTAGMLNTIECNVKNMTALGGIN